MAKTTRIHATYRERKQHCPSPFIVWFQERSGSTFLCSMLESHPEIFCRLEDFVLVPEEGPPRENAFLRLEFRKRYYYRRLNSFEGTIEDPSRQRTVQHLREIMSQPFKACGFKFKFDMQVAGYRELVRELNWIANSLKVIFLERKNVLKQAISRQNMKRLHEIQGDSNLKASKKLPSLELDIDEAIIYANHVSGLRAKFEESVLPFPNVHRICYEDLQADPQSVMKGVLEFLEVDTNFELSSQFEKVTPNTISAAISNYQRLRERVKGTDYESMLD